MCRIRSRRLAFCHHAVAGITAQGGPATAGNEAGGRIGEILPPIMPCGGGGHILRREVVEDERKVRPPGEAIGGGDDANDALR